MTDLRMNERTCTLADQLVDRGRRAARRRPDARERRARRRRRQSTRRGAFRPGLALAELCMGGLGHVEFTSLTIAGESWPGVQVWTDHPAVSCMASQYAGWAINPEGFFAMGSGPLRAKARVEKRAVRQARLRRGGGARRARAGGADASRPTPSRPGSPARPASRPTGSRSPIAPTASLAGGVQIVARVLETGLHKMDTLGFDVTRVRQRDRHRAAAADGARATCAAIGRTNDCILYGGQARYIVRRRRRRSSPSSPTRLPASALRRLRHAVLRHLQALRQRLL